MTTVSSVVGVRTIDVFKQISDVSDTTTIFVADKAGVGTCWSRLGGCLGWLVKRTVCDQCLSRPTGNQRELNSIQLRMAQCDSGIGDVGGKALRVWYDLNFLNTVEPVV